MERKRACGRPNCHCADGKKLHLQYQISVVIDGQPKAFNVPAKLVEPVRQHVEMRTDLQDYHRLVAVTVVSTPFPISLGIRFQKDGEAEVPCALALLQDLAGPSHCAETGYAPTCLAILVRE